ncbi:MAG: excinuclease ABC subunit UvrA [Planctomycetaceae bacterium]|jgi:excinuclease ABC subunit A|nr:excinuclease ABC subunit UvrA [Planctomycetaceae bacterium]
MSQHSIHVERARVHNLKEVTLDIPRNKLVVLTGPSGSGKSSLAFDTIYAEGRRQYMESLSIYAREFLHLLERPDVEYIRGLQPTISIDQKSGSGNPRSTVATMTEIYDYLRILYSRVGLAHCWNCGRAIRQQSVEQILEEVLSLPENCRLILLAPLVRGQRGQHAEVFRKIIKAGFVRARVDGAMIDVEEPPEMDPLKRHDIETIIDRIVLRDGIRARLAESLKLAVKFGEGLVIVSYEKERTTHQDGTTRSFWQDILYSTKYACPKCKINYLELEPRTFSFNSPYGACPECQGMGRLITFDPELVMPDRSLTLKNGAILPWKSASVISAKLYERYLERFYDIAGDLSDVPLADWLPEQWNLFCWGNVEKNENGENAEACEKDSAVLENSIKTEASFSGIVKVLEEIYRTSRSKTETERLEAFRNQIRCRTCEGTRLRREARSVTIAKHRIHEVCAMTIEQGLEFFRTLEFSEEQQSVTQPILEQVISRLEFLHQIGLDYLTFDRSADSLSGGELQRVRLAAGLGTGLVGVCYVLDEPSVGLHSRDNQRLIDAMRCLQKRGNSVLVVEHDETIMREADWLIDVGPGAGALGGKITAEGVPHQIEQNPDSLTGKYLTGKLVIPVPPKRRKMVKNRSIVLEGCTLHNLKNVNVSFPLGVLTCVTGVSGSGKSSLLNETLIPALSRRLNGGNVKPGPHQTLRGACKIDKLICVDQSSIGRSPRSNPATYTGILDEIRKIFAATKDAKARGYKSSRFSFNVAGGRCETCLGQGIRKIEMHFLPDLYAVCPVCEGKRFNKQTLGIKYKEKSIAEVLDMPVSEAVLFFENFPVILRVLESLERVGLGYLPLGQASTTLSGGEAQRIKLAGELAKTETGNTLYVLDEPTSGLHAHDVSRLLDVLSELVNLGNTVIVIEHNLDVAKVADWIIDLGPEGGERGGYILAVGTPEEIAALPDNETGRFLRNVLKKPCEDCVG